MISSTDSVSATAFILPPSNPQQTSRNGELGRGEFLLLLVAQLRNQSPLSPQDGTAFVAQMAQFSAVDELIAIKESIRGLARLIPPPQPPPAPPASRMTPFGPTSP